MTPKINRPRTRDASSRTALSLMLLLTFSTGIIDAVGYLGLDRVFTGNMTGNVVILGMALVGADGLPVLGPTIALVAFMLGALGAGRALRTAGAGWSGRTSALLCTVTVILLACALTTLLLADPAQPVALGITGGLGAAMGVQAAAARHLGVKDVTTVVVTSTMTGLAAESWLGSRVQQPWVRRFLAIILILLGAAVGAIVIRAGLALGILISALISTVVTVAGHTRLRHRGVEVAG
ncbi:YoaK family protein [Microbacterium sp. HJ5]